MNPFYVAFCRIYQTAFRIGAYALPWHKPCVLRGGGGLAQLAGKLKEKKIGHVMLITDRGVAAAGLPKPVLDALKAQGIAATIYDGTVPNPTIANIEEALALYRAQGCQALVALGGGSPIDCAKGVGARLCRPRKTIPQMRGQLKIWKRIPLFAAIPTTSGTGSETTLAAVITDGETHEKYAVNDPSLIPHFAVLDPALTAGMPAHITATTGVDALTHAVEAFIGRSNTKKTRECALRAARLIFAHLPEAYRDGRNLAARAQMQEASFLAGAAFTRAYVGNVHAIAHTLGGQYGTPHGLANAVILPHVLRAYGEAAHRPLAALAAAASIGDDGMSAAQRADAFIEAVCALNRSLNIPETIADLREADIPMLAGRALREANPLYPVPRILGRSEIEAIYRKISKKGAAA